MSTTMRKKSSLPLLKKRKLYKSELVLTFILSIIYTFMIHKTAYNLSYAFESLNRRYRRKLIGHCVSPPHFTKKETPGVENLNDLFLTPQLVNPQNRFWHITLPFLISKISIACSSYTPSLKEV